MEKDLDEILIDNLFEFLADGTEKSKKVLAGFMAAGIISMPEALETPL